eukprot:gene22949-27928_t
MDDNLCTQASSLPQIQCIQLPALVRRQEQAFQMLGGRNTIESALSTPKPSFTFSFPDDPNPNSTLTSTQDSSVRGFVVCIRRKKGSKETGKASVIGYVDGVHTFRSMMDFQFTPHSYETSHYEEQVKRYLHSDTTQTQQAATMMEATPQAFSHVDYNKRAQFLSFAYALKSQSAMDEVAGEANPQDEAAADEEGVDAQPKSDTETPVAPLRQKKVYSRPYYSSTVLVKTLDPELSSAPIGHPEGFVPVKWANKPEDFRGVVLITQIRALMDIIPILSKQQICDLLDLSSRPNLFKDCLPFGAYTFVDGPWLHLWCRFSYSPQLDANSWIFQTIRLKLPQSFLKGISDRLEKHIGTEKLVRRLVDLDKCALTDTSTDFSFAFIDKGANARVPISYYQQILKNQVSFQLLNIQDDEGFNFICSDLKRSNTCQDTGFFPSESCDKFRQFIVQSIEQRTEEMLQMPAASIAYTPKLQPDIPMDMPDQQFKVFLEDRVAAIKRYMSGLDECGDGLPQHVLKILDCVKRYQEVAKTSNANFVLSSRPAASQHQAIASSKPSTSSKPVAATSAASSRSSKAMEMSRHDAAGRQGLTNEVQGFDIFAQHDSSDSEA